MTKPKNPQAISLTVEQRIRDAKNRRAGMHLSAPDVLRLYGYDEIRDAAASDDQATPQGGQKTLLDG